MSFDHLSVEKALQRSIILFDIDHLPNMDNTGSLKSALIFLNDESMNYFSKSGVDGSKHVYDLLYDKHDGDMGHLHARNKINDVLAEEGVDENNLLRV